MQIYTNVDSTSYVVILQNRWQMMVFSFNIGVFAMRLAIGNIQSESYFELYIYIYMYMCVAYQYCYRYYLLYSYYIYIYIYEQCIYIYICTKCIPVTLYCYNTRSMVNCRGGRIRAHWQRSFLLVAPKTGWTVGSRSKLHQKAQYLLKCL